MKHREAITTMSLLALLGVALGRTPKSTYVGAGVQRAHARLKAKRIANETAAPVLDEENAPRPPSRQVLRARSRVKAKEYRGMLKSAALKDRKALGGAAVVR